MNKIIVLSELSPARFESITELWTITGVGNPQRGDTYDSVCHTLKHGARILIAYEDEQPVGTLWLTHDFRRLYVHHMAVHPVNQNKGIGRMLLKAALDIAAELGLQAKLEVHSDNPAACHLYESMGFKALDGYSVMIKRDI
jgi:[ribosomal protein S18]-alanine N-acetyltransferase